MSGDSRQSPGGDIGVEVFLGLGSNLGQPEQQIARALTELQRLSLGGDPIASPLYRSAPIGPPDQPDYINAVVGMFTLLDPDDMLREIQAIELAHGRVRGERWGPRTLDIDLLLYGERIIDAPHLKVPHPGLTERPFVLYPLYDIAPDLMLPGLGPLAERVARGMPEDLHRLATNGSN